jgi:DNA ligase (NAD+)
MNVTQNETLGVLSEITIVITGTLEKLSRKEAINYIESHGGTVRGSITSKTSYLLVGENPGIKLEHARKLGVPEIDVNRLRELAN